MKVDVCFTADLATPDKLRNKTAVIIDVLRASTTITRALAEGAAWIHPAAEIEEARNIYRKFPKFIVLLGGERKGIKIPNFDLGNSPYEYNKKRVNKRGIVLATSNGSRALKSAIGNARQVIVASLTNMSKAVNYLTRENKNDIMLVCACRQGEFSIEDAIGAGGIANMLKSRNIKLTPAATLASSTYKFFKDKLTRTLQESPNGRGLVRLGYGRDVIYCSRVDVLNMVPVLQGHRFIAWKG